MRGQDAFPDLWQVRWLLGACGQRRLCKGKARGPSCTPVVPAKTCRRGACRESPGSSAFASDLDSGGEISFRGAVVSGVSRASHRRRLRSTARTLAPVIRVFVVHVAMRAIIGTARRNRLSPPSSPSRCRKFLSKGDRRFAARSCPGAAISTGRHTGRCVPLRSSHNESAGLTDGSAGSGARRWLELSNHNRSGRNTQKLGPVGELAEVLRAGSFRYGLTLRRSVSCRASPGQPVLREVGVRGGGGCGRRRALYPCARCQASRIWSVCQTPPAPLGAAWD